MGEPLSEAIAQDLESLGKFGEQGQKFRNAWERCRHPIGKNTN